MKILLVGVNAKYVQTNLAIRLLKAYAVRHCPSVAAGTVQIELREWNINLPVSNAVRGTFETGADLVLFSTYVWNREFVMKACSELRKVLPAVLIGLGGPEVSWDAQRALEECPAADVIFSGEGEETFAEVVNRVSAGASLEGVRSLYIRSGGSVLFAGNRESVQNLDDIPFPYADRTLDFDPENRIVYYESSRGCPFSCAYCLSSLDRSVRYYPVDRVLAELDFFMDRQFPLVKFVDRTFNLDPVRYLAIWKHIRDFHNGKTLFHFEIAAELLTEESFNILESMPEGSIQLEIGIQSINPETLSIVGRPAHPEILAEKIRRIPSAVHTHIDLIAGLPAENLASFARSFDYAFALGAGMLQLGFLKILEGSPMEVLARASPGYLWSEIPPYEVLQTPVLAYADILLLKDIEHLVDVWYNSGLLRNVLRSLVSLRPAISAFEVFRELSCHVTQFFPDADPFLPRKPADLFACMASFLKGKDPVDSREYAILSDWLKFDYLMQGKPGVFPEWYDRRYSREEHELALVSEHVAEPKESRRTLYGRTEYERFTFASGDGEQGWLFVYGGNGTSSAKKKVCCKRV